MQNSINLPNQAYIFCFVSLHLSFFVLHACLNMFEMVKVVTEQLQPGMIRELEGVQDITQNWGALHLAWKYENHFT